MALLVKYKAFMTEYRALFQQIYNSHNSSYNSPMAAAAGADPADKTKLEEAAKTIDSLESALSDPTQWQSALETVTTVFSYLLLLLCSSLHPLDMCCISTLPIYICAIDSRSSLCSATPHKGSLRWRLSRRYFPIYICSLFLFTSARYVLHSKDLCCISRICAVFQIFLFTSALLIHARVCAQQPRQWQSTLEMVTKVLRADCNQGNGAVVNRKIPWLQSVVQTAIVEIALIFLHWRLQQWQSALETFIKVFSCLQLRYVPLYIRSMCAVFQLSLFTSAPLIRARVCAQRPHTMAVCAGDCQHVVFLFTSALFSSSHLLDMCCISGICAAFQIFLFTTALLIRARVCAQ